MKEYPILFSAPMVRAVLDGRKTQTRRIMKKQPNIDAQTGDWLFTFSDGSQQVSPIEHWVDLQIKLHCPYGQPGDHLWVRETFAPMRDGEVNTNAKPYRYKADWKEGGNVDGVTYSSKAIWKPSIFMPRAAARILLEVVDVRVERLQDISEADAVAEGVEISKTGKYYLNYVDQKNNFTQFIFNCDTAKESYQTLWKTINGPDSWEANPWVWVVEFNKA